MKLISMVNFVLERIEYWRTISIHQNGREEFYRSTHSKECENYANFLKQILELWMLIPCNEDGKVFEMTLSEGDEYYDAQLEEFEKAKERVLFEGCYITEHGFLGFLDDMKDEVCVRIMDSQPQEFHLYGDYPISNIEGLIHYDFTLTQTAIKQIEL